MCLAVVASGVLQEPPPDVTIEGTLSLPSGAVAELLERIGPLPRPSRPAGLDWPAWTPQDGAAGGPDPAWDGELPWRSWIELARAEGAAERPDPLRRARLAVLARMQGRDGDAWRHLLACEDDPALVAALLPFFVPGVPRDHLGSEAPLSSGVLLAPALPPATEDPRGSLRSLVGRSLEQGAFAVESARLSLSVRVEQDGLEVEVVHLEGPEVRVRVIPPLPQRVDPGLVFADWERSSSGPPVDFTLSADSPEHTLWLTFHRPDSRWPAPLPSDLPPLAPARRIRVVSPRGDEPRLARFAEALAELFGVPAELASETEPPRPGLLEPLVLHLDPERAGERKLVSLIGLAESRALEQDRR